MIAATAHAANEICERNRQACRSTPILPVEDLVQWGGDAAGAGERIVLTSTGTDYRGDSGQRATVTGITSRSPLLLRTSTT